MVFKFLMKNSKMDHTYNFNEEVHVSFVHKDIKPLVFPTKDGTLNCQTVLQRCIEHVCVALRIPLSECKGPHFLPLFGVVTLPKERIWLPRNHVFKPSCDTPRLYKFKVRFRPPADYVGHIKTNSNNVLWEYLFLQIHDDFLTGKLVESTKLDVRKIFNLLTYALLMPSELPYDNTIVVNEKYRKERRIRLWQITSFLSKPLSSRLISTFLIDHYWISDSLRENTKQLKSRGEALGNYKKKFYQMIVEAEPNYGSEQYEEVQVLMGRDSEEVTVTIGYYGENQQPALYFGEELQFTLSDILYIKLSLPKNNNNKRWTVTVELKDEKSFELFFKEECAAKSFLSMVQSFYSLYVQYDKHLNSDIQTAESKISSEIFSFGPLKQSTVEKYLKEPKAPIDTDNKCFLIHESMTDFGTYVVVSANKRKRDSKEIIDIRKMMLKVNKNQTFTLREDADKEIIVSDIRTHLRKEFGVQLHPKHYHHISEIEHIFKAEESEMYKDHYKLAEHFSNGQIFLPDELDKQRVLIRDKNPFLKKFQVSLNGEKMMLVELQADNGKIAEAFRSGLSDLMKLHKVKPDNFMKFYGMVVDKKLCALLEYSQSLDLLTFICQHPQSVPQKVDIMDKIIKIFGVMENYRLFHGNIRLRKFTVFTGDNRIKLGDAGIAAYLNSEDKYHKDNNERLPWLSPERRLKMKKVTCESECYAVGTTLCEVLYRNDQFAEILKLSDPKDLWQYFKEKEHLPKPDLYVDHSHAKGRKDKDCLICKGIEVLENVWNRIIIKCWATDPLERPSAADLQKVFSEEIKVKSDDLDRNSVTEGLKQVMYDIGLKDEIEDNNLSKAKLEEILMTRMKQKYLSEDCLSLDQKELGRGYFGVVWEGKIRTPNRNQVKPSQKDQWRKVAVKRFCKREPSRGERCSNNSEKNFVQEVILACSLKHKNIVQVLHFSFHHSGAEFSNIVLIMEFMNAGDLRRYAERNANVESQEHYNQLLKICFDVAEGMVYLNGKAIVHRDLAARNILLAKSSDGQIVGKISDFGLARKMEENYRFYKNKHLTMLPFAWMPPECLNRCSEDNRFTSEGDVWSFGTLTWEAFTKGKNPKKLMPLLDPGNVEQYLLRQYEKGWRLPKEGYYSDDIYTVMNQCWQINPKQRPAFVDLVETLRGLLGTRL